MTKKKKQDDLIQAKDGQIALATKMLKSGHSDIYIKKHLYEISKDHFTVNDIADIVTHANTHINNEYQRKIKNIVCIHTARYNREVTRLLNTTEIDEKLVGLPADKGGKSELQFLNSRKRKVKAFDRALNSMAAMEQLLNLGYGSKIEIDTIHNINITEAIPENKQYDLSKLSFEELKELGEIQRTARGANKEIQSVTEVIRDEQQVTEDVEAIVLPPNIESIKHEVLQPAPEERTFTDPLSKLKANIRAMAAKKLKDACANLDNDELDNLLKGF
jgi:hypothetical protein